VADGTESSERSIERVLTCDPGIGVLRLVDAGYAPAIEFAEQAGLRAPMRAGAAHPSDEK
jgi:urocanate hydratase